MPWRAPVGTLLLLLGMMLPAAGQGITAPPNSPTNPTAYSWPGYHAGGATISPLIPPSDTNNPITTPSFPPSPLFSQLQGTPSGFFPFSSGKVTSGSYVTEIASFLIGNYDVLNPPSSTDTTGAAQFSNHFFDDTGANDPGFPLILSISAPFTFATPTPAITDNDTVDDSDGTNTTFSAGWTSITDSTATNQNYHRVLANVGVSTQTATYRFTVATAGLYSFAFHLPIRAADINRIGDAHYVITNTTTNTILYDGTVNQTETNDIQFLAGPFTFAANETVSVVLDNSTADANVSLPNSNYYVVADSISVVPGASAGTGAQTNGSPAAINVTQFPEIADAYYLGLDRTSTTPGQPDPVPYGTQTIGDLTTIADKFHAIRQLVYFGRYENIVLTNKDGVLVNAAGSTTEINGNAVKTPVIQKVGAVYCMDGLTGAIVWRFQTPDILDSSGNIVTYDRDYNTLCTPSIARMNVLVAPNTYATKLCVVIADVNGLVYCLDAIGNRNGTCNNNALNTTYNQPIYNPTAAFQDQTISGVLPHVGTTNAYWIYRPGGIKSAAYGGATLKAATVLPVPQSFGIASPTIFVDPHKPIDLATLVPSATPVDSSVLRTFITGTDTTAIDDGVVYIGNSNGTLYQLDALGIDATAEKYNDSLTIGIKSDALSLTATPTCQPGWWFTTNGGSTNSTDLSNSYSITSAPSILQTTATTTSTTLKTTTGTPPAPDYTIYFSTTAAQDSKNFGRVYAVSSAGPSGTPGTVNYNSSSRPAWVFPNAYTDTGTAGVGIREALGDISGSPVVFTNPDDSTTRIYFAANVGVEGSGTRVGAEVSGGRIWAVEAVDVSTSKPAGSAAWAYPDTYDPNIAHPSTTIGGQSANTAPLGSFQYSTPAIGVVQFPSIIDYGTGNHYTHPDHLAGAVRADIKGASVPMLYIGSNTEAAVDGSDFYGVDLDGLTDNERNMFYYTGVVTPMVGVTVSSAGFSASPLLVVNPNGTPTSPGPGNGGSVFLPGGDNFLYEMEATPTSDGGPDAATTNAVQFISTPIFGGFGPFSSPAIAAYDASDLRSAAGSVGAFTISAATDWIYGCDGFTGFARGITPGDRTGTGDIDPGINPPPDYARPPDVLQNVPLHVYLFDNQGTHDAKSTNMGLANNIRDNLPVFEWGDNIYIRFSNVVPPNPPTRVNPYGDPKYWMTDGNITGSLSGGLSTLSVGDVIYTDGQPITVQLGDVDASGRPIPANGGDISQVPSNLITTGTLAPVAPSTEINEGFVQENPSESGQQDILSDELKDGSGNLWLGAVTYNIGDGSNRKNTPGSRRRVVSAKQTAQAYEVVAGVAGGPNVLKALSSVNLLLAVNSAPSTVSRTVIDPTTGRRIRRRRRVPPSNEPTYGILNPIAVRGGGVPIPLSTSTPAQAAMIGTGQNGLLGPFDSYDPSSLTQDSLAALTNGNRVYSNTGDLPKNGILGGNNHAMTDVTVVTATGDIAHGSTGDNGDLNNVGKAPLITTARSGSGLFGGYTLNVADRSSLGLVGSGLKNLAIEDNDAQWNDNTPNGTGAGAAVNPLPWEDLTRLTKYGSGPNSSQDYPNVATQSFRQTLYRRGTISGSTTMLGTGVSMSGSGTAPDAATANGSTPTQRTINTDAVQIQISMPKYQPANLQVYAQANPGNGPTTPDQMTTGTTAFPMGYVSEKRIYVDSNQNRKCDSGEAYRTILVYTGVPVDMTTRIVNQTTDLGKLPQSFGVQTDNYNSLSLFTPYTPGYQSYFKPLTVLNEGNVNLLNVQFDQRLTNLTQGTNLVLNLQSDTLDPLALIQTYDANGVTGPRTVSLPTGDVPLPFLVRTSLDTDLVRPDPIGSPTVGANYGRNPYILTGTDPTNGSALASEFPGATFHKSRVGDGTPALLTVPDVPHDNTPGAIGYMPLAPSGAPPTLSVGGVPIAATLPYVGLAVPLGTPVGTYTQSLQLFEGILPTGYANISGTGGYYSPLLPPMYGTASGSNPPEISASFTIAPTTGARFQQPTSTPTILRATVTETRVTDGATYGNLPQVDPYIPSNVVSPVNSDFLPTAFRDAYWNGGAIGGSGSLSLYWTSSRGNITPGATPPYNIVGENLPYKSGYFRAAGANNWFGAAGTNVKSLMFPNALTAGTNTGMSIAVNQHLLNGGGAFSSDGSVFAFVQNVQGGGTTPYQNTIYCYGIDPATGRLNNFSAPVTADPSQPHSGVRGLKFVNPGDFTDALDNATQIPSNLWAFWNGGGNGRSGIFYGSANTTASSSSLAFGPSSALPLPSGVSTAADPSAVLVQTTDSANRVIHAIDVTYSGTGADGNADLYVSRYRPYYQRLATGGYLLDANGNKVVGLALVGAPLITEQLQPDSSRQFFQARDVAWARTDTQSGTVYKGTFNVTVNGVTLLRDVGNAMPLYSYSATQQPIRETYDRASGTLVFTGVDLKGGGGGGQIYNIYADLARGRVRFSPSLPDTANVTATFQSQARRITTDSRADTGPVSFIDEAYKPNESSGLKRVSAARYWFIWRKSGAPGTSTVPTLYSKTQRLTLYLHTNGTPTQPVSLSLNPTTKLPTGLTLMDNTTGAAISADAVDVDWVHGRIYFPLMLNNVPMEGHTVTATFDYLDRTLPAPYINSSGRIQDVVRWTDELRGNDSNNQPGSATAAAVDTTEHAIPIDVAANEGSVSAFLDPLAYADVFNGAYDPTGVNTGFGNPDQPHKVWLFWNSTRNGTSDIYYETIAPRFTANP